MMMMIHTYIQRIEKDLSSHQGHYGPSTDIHIFSIYTNTESTKLKDIETIQDIYNYSNKIQNKN